jgi:hypothetical protein
LASLMLLDSVSLAACTSETPLSSVSKIVQRVQARLRRRGRSESGKLQRSARRHATGCVVAPVPSSAFPRDRKERGNSTN